MGPQDHEVTGTLPEEVIELLNNISAKIDQLPEEAQFRIATKILVNHAIQQKADYGFESVVGTMDGKTATFRTRVELVTGKDDD